MTFTSRIPQIIGELSAKLETAAEAGAELIADRAKERAPVNTGSLRDSIHVERTGLGEFAVVAGNTDVFYGHIVEHGSVHTPARPFLIPALEESREEVEVIAAAALRTL